MNEKDREQLLRNVADVAALASQVRSIAVACQSLLASIDEVKHRLHSDIAHIDVAPENLLQCENCGRDVPMLTTANDVTVCEYCLGNRPLYERARGAKDGGDGDKEQDQAPLS